MALILKLFFNADSIPPVKWLRASISFVLFKFTTVNTLISASTLPLLWKIQNHCSVIEPFDHQNNHSIYLGRTQERKAAVVICQVHMHGVSLVKYGEETNLPEIHSSNIVYLENARFIKMTLYLQKKGQSL